MVELMDKEWRRINEEKEKIEEERQRLIQTLDFNHEQSPSGDD